jgi:hypothetical protein
MADISVSVFQMSIYMSTMDFVPGLRKIRDALQRAVCTISYLGFWKIWQVLSLTINGFDDDELHLGLYVF